MTIYCRFCAGTVRGASSMDWYPCNNLWLGKFAVFQCNLFATHSKTMQKLNYHVSRVFTNSKQWPNHEELHFEYHVLTISVSGYMKLRCFPSLAHFSTPSASIRVKVEHTIGRLTGKFQSLRGLRVVIKSSAVDAGLFNVAQWKLSLTLSISFLRSTGDFFWNSCYEAQFSTSTIFYRKSGINSIAW